MVKVPPIAVLQPGSCASSGRTWRLWAARHSQGEPRPLGSQPRPQLLELATSKVAHFTACVHAGDIGYYCAFNLPGVAQAVGPGRWEELSDAFLTLSNNVQWKVRRTPHALLTIYR